MKLAKLFLTLLVISLFFDTAVKAGQPSVHCVPGKIDSFSLKFRSEKTGYFPDDSEMEGGFVDRAHRPLRTLQAYLTGKAPYVSVAMDYLDKRFPYGTVLRIPDLERLYHKCIDFRIVDTGGRFKHKGTKKIDICNNNEDNANRDEHQGISEVYVVGHKE